ncbi:MAG: glycosyltransferase [Bacteroidia bacterium]|nr:glycosyltransferase [Bacteroidota bacterium]MBP9789506.1 glycosyltransferase [Bacteroidia bacterium]MBP9922914.1 glycosyltransferase [Bacteroidia bacterium]
MSSDHLHIISFDVPYPADYGGVIDVFYKLKALHQLGVKITLHCFEYGRPEQKELNKYAQKVYYYPRKNSRSLLFTAQPYIVLTRSSELLKERLLKDNDPILMEGLHSTILLNDADFRSRKIYVRTHNIEHDYYSNLAKVEKNIFKRYYFYNESGKLLKYESVLKKAACVFAISPADTEHFKKITKKVEYLPAFHPFETVSITESKADYFLYHGNLSVGENNEAALFLINEVFNDIPHKLVIAGSKPSAELQKLASERKNVELIQNCSPEKIYDLIAHAKCNILPTFQSTGIKLKLLAALFLGKECIVNTPMVVNTGLEALCEVADTPNEMKKKIAEIAKQKEFSKQKIEMRKQILEQNFSNKSGAIKLSKVIF